MFGISPIPMFCVAPANSVFVTGTATVYTDIIDTKEPGYTVSGIKVVNDSTAFGGTGSNYSIVKLYKTPSGGSQTLLATLNLPTDMAAGASAYLAVDALASGVPPTGMPVSTAAPSTANNTFGPGDKLEIILGKAGTPVKSAGAANIYLCIE